MNKSLEGDNMLIAKNSISICLTDKIFNEKSLFVILASKSASYQL